ncbi:MAG: MFS transporter [Thermodesulfobacteriota bacterium]
MIVLNKKIFGVLFFSIFTAVMGVGIVVPLLPVYAHDLGASGLYIGLIFGSFSLSRTLFLPYFGRLSDRKGRKPFIACGLFAYSLVSIAFILSNDVATLIVIRFFQGIASAMIMPVAQAYVGDITSEGDEGFSMGLFNMSIFLSLSIGPLLGGIISDRFSLKAAFFCMGILAFIGFLLSYFFLPQTREERSKSFGKKPISWVALIRDRELAGLFVFRLSYTACIGVIWAFLPVFASVNFALSPSLIGILVMLGVLISGLIQTPAGYIADRVNRKIMILAGGGIACASLVFFQNSSGFWNLFYASVLFGIGGGISMPPLMALAVTKGNQAEAMGSVMAILTMAHSIGMMTGSIVAGLTMDLFQLRYAFMGGAVIMLLGLAAFMMTWISLKKREA